MTTEETELTFVRCPSCRSLIPAIATRCRMCGAQFEKKAEATADSEQDSGDAQKRSRVRQRTISASSEEVDQIKQQINDGRDAEPSEPEHQESDDIPMARTGSFKLPEREDSGFALDEEKMRFRTTREEDAPVAEAEEDVAPPADRNGRSQAPTNLSATRPEEESEEDWSEESEDFDDEEDEENAEDNSIQPSFARPEGKRRRRRRRRKRGGHTGGEQSIAAQGAAAPAQSPESPSQHSQPQPQQQRSASPASRPAPDAAATHVARQPVRQSEPAPVRNEESYQEPMQEQHQEAPRRQADNSNRAFEQAAQSSGDLVGWLVDYSGNTRGTGIELRGGRFFVGRQKLRNGDMLFTDSSISTPHCMVTAAPGESLQVQDLMSERGTYVKRAGSDNYAPVTNSVSLEHGDWLKLGEYEVLVCFVPRGAKARK